MVTPMTGQELRFAGMLLITMAMSTASFFAIVVVASEIQSELGISRFQLGVLGAVNTGVGGFFGVKAGQICDQLGGRQAMGLVLIISGATSAFMAVLPGYLMLLLGMTLAGFAQGLGNPATNKAIATGIAAHRRGLMTGLKQSGVQLAVFATGFAMPAISAAFGWRTGLWIAAGISFAAIVGLGAITELAVDDVSDQSIGTATSASTRLSPFVYQVGIYGFLLGSIGGGVGRFTPLFAEEAVGFSPAAAGVVFGLAGLVAIPSRVASGVLLDRGVSPRRTLVILGVGTTVAMVLTWLADPGPGAVLWIATILSGLTLGTWNTAANLAMVRQGADAGRASGVLVVGFMLGLTIAGPIVGWSIDSSGSYTPAFLGSAVIAALAVAAVTGDRETPAVSD